MQSIFELVKDRFASAPREWIETLGLTFGKKDSRGEGTWISGVVCPACSDSDGSASIASNSGFLNCHACSTKMELFEWVTLTQDIKTGDKPAYDAAKWLAKTMGIPIPTSRPLNLNRPPSRADQQVFDAARKRLVDDVQHSGRIHSWMRARGWDVAEAAELGLGAFGNNELIIFCFDEQTGELRPRYRKYSLKTKTAKWSYGTDRNTGEKFEPGRRIVPGFWPRNQVRSAQGGNKKIFVTEGEWDAISARLLCQSSDSGCPPIYAWQGGAGNVPAGSTIPGSWSDKLVVLIWDVDQFQGPDPSKVRGPKTANVLSQLDPEKSSLRKFAEILRQHGCRVEIAAVPLDPIDFPNGDLRDWIQQGNRDLDQLPTYRPEEIWGVPGAVQNIRHLAELSRLPQGTKVHFQGQVMEFDPDRTVIPLRTTIQCPFGEPEFEALCSRCGIPRQFPDFEIDWTRNRRELFQAYSSSSPDQTLLKILGKPQGCASCVLHHTEEDVGWFWGAMDEEDSSQTVRVVGGQPTISGRMEVDGVVYTTYKGGERGVIATTVREVDSTDFRMPEEQVATCEHLTPSATATADDIQKFLDERYLDISSNVTKIYNRAEFHQIVDLVYHSALFIRPDQERIRGFLDVCLFGDTRVGKTKVLERYMNAVSLGKLRTPLSTISRAGLLISNRDGKLRPGLWPKNHGRLIALDEFHNFAQNKSLRQIIVELQNARDAGTITSGKDAGDFTLPAAVRLLTIANWWINRESYTRPVDHLSQLYTSQPQVISRLDFAYAAQKDKLGPATPTKVRQYWTQELLRASVRRAWAQTEDDIVFEPEAIQVAMSAVAEWDDEYDAVVIPLYTGADKAFSILRVATAVANICFSHPGGDPRRCLVRAAHAHWARRWIEKTWTNLQYDDHSATKRRLQEVREEHRAVAVLFGKIHNVMDAQAVLPRMCDAMEADELSGLFQWENIMDGRNFVSAMKRHQIFEVAHDDKRMLYPTRGGRKLLTRLMDLALGDADRFNWYRDQVMTWFQRAGNDPMIVTPKKVTDDDEWHEILQS